MSGQENPGVLFVMDFPIDRDSGIEKHAKEIEAIITEAGKELERGQVALLKKYGGAHYVAAKLVCNSVRIQGVLHRHGIDGTMMQMLHQHHCEMIQNVVAAMKLDFDVIEKLADGIDEHMKLMQQQVKERIEDLIKQESKNV